MTPIDLASRDAQDLSSPALTRDPHAYFAQLRSEEPIHWNPFHRAWLVTRYDDVSDGLRDPRLRSNRMASYRARRVDGSAPSVAMERAFTILESWMVFQDEPDHRRLRGIVHKAFTPRRVQQLETMVTDLVEREVAQLKADLGRRGGRVDVLHEFAYGIPASVISRMLGIPEVDQHQFVAWSDDLVGVISGDVGDLDRNHRAERAVHRLTEYLLSRIATSTASVDGNLLEALLAAEEDGDRLSRDEVIATCILLLFAGHRTTACLITTAWQTILSHRRAYDRLLEDRSLVPAAIEEVLRYEGHTKLTVRVVGEEFAWHDATLSVGDRVFLATLSANRDERIFDDPNTFMIGRPNAQRHIGFGAGIHYCLGAPLARLEARVALDVMLRELPTCRLVEPEPTWIPTLISRTQASLPVEFVA